MEELFNAGKTTKFWATKVSFNIVVLIPELMRIFQFASLWTRLMIET